MNVRVPDVVLFCGRCGEPINERLICTAVQRSMLHVRVRFYTVGDTMIQPSRCLHFGVTVVS